MFAVSDKVVCVDAAPRHGALLGEYDFPNGYLEKGRIYVVKHIYSMSVQKVPNGKPQDSIRLVLVGLPALSLVPTPNLKAGDDFGWDSERFRKLDEIKAENAAKKRKGQTA